MARLGSRIAPMESWAARMRRWANSAKGNNPYELPQLRGAQGWRAAPNWTAATAYMVGNAVNANSQLWICIVAGTSGSTAPSGVTAGTVFVDGAVRWLWQPYSAGTYVSNGGSLYRVRTGGLPATSGAGPLTNDANISDGTAVVDYVGPQECPIILHASAHDSALTKQHTPAVVDANSLVRWRGGIPVVRMANDVSLAPTVWTYSTDIGPATGAMASNPANGIQRDGGWNGFEIRHEGVKCEVALTSISVGTSMAYDIMLDGQFIAGQAFTPTNSGSQQITFDFTNLPRKSRIIAFEGRFVGLNNIATEATGSFQKPARVDDSYVVAGICDSHGYGVGSILPASANFFHTLAHLMGWPDDSCDAIGGTGYINAGASTNFVARGIPQLQRLAAYKTIHAILIQGSQNDSAQPAAAVTAVALGFYQAIRAAGFSQPIFVVGTPSNGGPSAAHIANENAVKAAVAAQQAAGDSLIWHIDISTALQPVIFGTGRQGATNGSGNSDFNIGLDATHLSNAGALHLAQYLRDRINAILAGQP